MYDIPLGHLSACQICYGEDFQQVIDMGFFAPCDSLLPKEALQRAELTHPLNLIRCRECGLLQIDYAVDPKELFHPDYPYRSGITEALRKNLYGMAERVAGKIKLKKGDLVVDIGSNDGTLLQGFKNLGMRVLGVEPTNIAEIARANGIETVQSFFHPDLAQVLVKKHGKAALVTGTNVFAHVKKFAGLMAGVRDLLVDDGHFLTESHYLLDILDTLQYDSIYHEHLRFYLLKPLIKFLGNTGFSFTDVERIPNYGGSIRVYARKGQGHKPDKSVAELIKLEESKGAYKEKTYAAFAGRMRAHRRDLRALMVRLNSEGKSVAGVGCPGRAATLLAYAGITPDLMPYIAEQSTSLKLGLFTPQTHIPVVDEKRMLKEQPDYAMILSWHYADPIIKSLRAKGLKSKIIVPLPEIRVLG